jgi:hypothetical protein
MTTKADSAARIIFWMIVVGVFLLGVVGTAFLHERGAWTLIAGPTAIVFIPHLLVSR